jgi:hypothetical protein
MIVEFIQKYGGNLDAEGLFWVEQQMESINHIETWKLDEVIAKEERYRDQWKIMEVEFFHR